VSRALCDACEARDRANADAECVTPGCIRSDVCYCGRDIIPPAYKYCHGCVREWQLREEIDASSDAYASWFDSLDLPGEPR
jgi:hypothetical protein